MAIRDVVTMGYGNGTFSPGVNKIPTLGYSINVVIAVDPPSAVYRSQVPADAADYRSFVPAGSEDYRSQVPADAADYRSQVPPQEIF